VHQAKKRQNPKLQHSNFPEGGHLDIREFINPKLKDKQKDSIQYHLVDHLLEKRTNYREKKEIACTRTRYVCTHFAVFVVVVFVEEQHFISFCVLLNETL
jgi:hypothetical protein